jgi:hypothetical protein
MKKTLIALIALAVLGTAVVAGPRNAREKKSAGW